MSKTKTISFQLSRLKTEPEITRKCIQCGSEKVYIHKRNKRAVTDYRIGSVSSVRMRCHKCNKTWTINPEGVTLQKQRTDRVIGFGILLYFLGLSYRGVAKAMVAICVASSKAAVYRDFVEGCEKAGSILKGMRGKGGLVVKRAGVDGVWQKVKGQEARGLLMLTDLDLDIAVEVAQVDEEDAQAVKKQLQEWVGRFGIEVVMTDEHTSYEHLDNYEESKVSHWLCQAHFKKSKIKRANELIRECGEKGYKRLPQYLEEIKSIVKELDFKDEAMLIGVYGKLLRYKKKGKPYYPRRSKTKGRRKTSVGYRVYKLAVDVMSKFGDIAGQDITTNNATERQNGLLLKLRSKTMRGFQLPYNITKFIWLSRWIRKVGRSKTVDLSFVV